MCYQSFSLFGLVGANPWPKFSKREEYQGLPPCQISSHWVNWCWRYPLQKNLAEKNSKWYIPSKPIGMWG